MIIELFGPPGVGKTTLACALAEHLRERGQAVALISSLNYRPTDDARKRSRDSIRHLGVAARRLMVPLFETISQTVHLLAAPHDTSTGMNVLRILQPRNFLWSIRMHQYILRLTCAWQRALLPRQTVVVDQGFVQAVYSLALLGRVVDEGLIALALDSIPKSDLLIRLTAPREILEARLAKRERLQSAIERLLEFDPKTNVASVTVIDRLQDLLLKRGWSVTCVNSLDETSLCEAVARIEAEVLARFSSELGAPAS